MVDPHRVWLAAAAWEVLATPARLLGALRAGGIGALERAGAEMDDAARARADTTAVKLAQIGAGALFYGEEGYPRALTELKSPPAILFYAGPLEIAEGPAVGMCGSRSASETGIRAARLCGMAVAREGLTVISGYARGVDTATHVAALDAGGRTIIVLAEGLLQFRVKRAFGKEVDPERVLVLSQFPPHQTWNVGAAMTRNAVIAALGRALVVIEASETGGTLDAGIQALAIKRPVIALEFESEATPAGNRLLLERGAIPVHRPAELATILGAIKDPSGAGHSQMPLELG